MISPKNTSPAKKGRSGIRARRTGKGIREQFGSHPNPSSNREALRTAAAATMLKLIGRGEAVANGEAQVRQRQLPLPAASCGNFSSLRKISSAF